ncbi:MAG TPA: divergent PAP2 family protein [Spirochaetales bacterium]|nr:divergent PAP2 family protein [Spirochaetales bacterium]HOV39624.1 divergent PAP2 family protein [Spirochaetales bacterium]
MPGTFTQALSGLAENPVFLSTFSAWFSAQFIKTLIEICRNRLHTAPEILTSLFWKTGGMPSSHSSLVTALATSIGITEGIDSALFATVFFYGILTIRDALGVRRSTGTQAQMLNTLRVELMQRYTISLKPVKEVHGHTPIEVSVGVLLGFFIALGICSL